MTEPLSGIYHNLSNEEYRDAPGRSATFLKGCLRSVKHALTPKPPTRALNTGLRAHEFILEREKFLATYVRGLDPEDYPDALKSVDDLRSAINTLNESRKPTLKTTGSRDSLLESIVADDPAHLDGVIDPASLSVTDLKKRIQWINSNPDRGILSTSGSATVLIERLRGAGYTGAIWSELVERHAAQHPDAIVLPPDEYDNYSAMYESLIDHLSAATDQPIMQWLLYALTTPGVLETEVSVFANGSKCRLDGRFMAGSKRVGVELKTTSDASEEAFGRQSARLHYDLQDSHYKQVCADAGEPLDLNVFIAIEPEAPYGVSVLLPDETFCLTGRKKLAYAHRKYNEWCAGLNKTAYAPVVKTLTSPAWAQYGPWEDESV